MSDTEFDWQRKQRTGIAEAVLCSSKTIAQIASIISDANERNTSLLLTRLEPDQHTQLLAQLSAAGVDNLRCHEYSGTAILDNGLPKPLKSDCLIITAGTSDMAVAHEAQQTLLFHGLDVSILPDCGVAGLWRLTDKLDQLRAAPIIIAIAGMEGALFPVLAGLIPGLVIAVPGSTGYGVAQGGVAALNTALATCSPGVLTVNIDNGFGAAAAMLKLHNALSINPFDN